MPNSLGLHILNIDVARMVAGQALDFTFRYMPGDHWIGADYRVQIKPAA